MYMYNEQSIFIAPTECNNYFHQSLSICYKLGSKRFWWLALLQLCNCSWCNVHQEGHLLARCKPTIHWVCGFGKWPRSVERGYKSACHYGSWSVWNLEAATCLLFDKIASGLTQTQLICHILDKLISIGVQPLSITFDEHQINMANARKLSCSL